MLNKQKTVAPPKKYDLSDPQAARNFFEKETDPDEPTNLSVLHKVDFKTKTGWYSHQPTFSSG